MNFFFKWINEKEEISLETSLQTDMEVLEFYITQREGEIALCHLTVPLNVTLYPHKYALIIAEVKGEKKALFKGKLRDMPVQINDWQQRLELFALPIDAAKKLTNIRNQLQEGEDWDPLFVDPFHRQDPVEALEAIPGLFCWHPVTHEVVVSDLFIGRQTRKFTPDHMLENSFSVRTTTLPKPYINVSLIAEWVQESKGKINLFPLIQNKFVSQKINTFTAKGIMDNWPRVGQLLGRSGYYVTESTLNIVTPSHTGALNLYPAFSPPITFKNKELSNIYLKRTWLEGKLKLGWDYRQRRREIVHFQLHHHSRIMARADTKKLNVVLRLADITSELISPSASSFFTTERGKKAIMHALKIARCHLAASARGIEIVFKVPLPFALSLSLDESIEIHHPALPEESMIGKLIDYKLFASFEDQWAELKIAVSTGQGKGTLPPTVEVIAETPFEGLPEGPLEPSYFIENVEVQNQAADQLQKIMATELENIGVLKEVLSSHGTEINIRLKDIRSTDVLERSYKITTPLEWSAPSFVKEIGK